jgi:hypothetical protein
VTAVTAERADDEDEVRSRRLVSSRGCATGSASAFELLESGEDLVVQGWWPGSQGAAVGPFPFEASSTSANDIRVVIRPFHQIKGATQHL